MIELKEKPAEWADSDDRKELALHMRRVADLLKVPQNLRSQVFASMALDIRRKLGLTNGEFLETRHLYRAHKAVDEYVIPEYILEMMEEQQEGRAFDEVV